MISRYILFLSRFSNCLSTVKSFNRECLTGTILFGFFFLSFDLGVSLSLAGNVVELLGG